jgi:hypothetical protein
MNLKSTTSFVISILAVLLLALSFTLVLNSKFRQAFNNLITSDERHIIANLETNLSLPNKSFKILKISAKKNLWIEIYDLNFSEDRVAEFKLPIKTDGRMFINNRASSLFASDLDGDQILEVIVPTFDLELNPRIYAYRYNPITDKFSEISDQDLLQKMNF